jgi:D-alanine transaminase|tara:strand:- start:1276 stop:2115 length:840 start_codon:yes stop_codon:yes gene_type:complete
MSWTYLNKDFITREEVKISPFDRGFLFGDGVYEVIPIYESKAFLLEEHIARLGRSLVLTGIKRPKKWNKIPEIIDNLVERNLFDNQSVYLQITRGEDSVRNHIPDPKVEPTLFITSSDLKVNPYRLNPEKKGLAVKILEDPRWDRCDIKAVTLLSNVIAMREANIEGKDGVIFCNKGKITEGASSNVFAVFDNLVVTSPESNQILSGITRKHVLSLLRAKGIKVLEKDINLVDLYKAEEVWMTSSTQEIQPVRKIDEKVIKFKSPKDSLWFELLTSYFF